MEKMSLKLQAAESGMSNPCLRKGSDAQMKQTQRVGTGGTKGKQREETARTNIKEECLE